MKEIIFIISLLVLGVNPQSSAISDELTSSQEKKWLKKVKKHRKKMEKHFLDPQESPLREEASHFSGNNYYSPDADYRVQATFTPAVNPESFKMKTSSPKVKDYQKYGTLSFTVKDTPLELTIYQSVRLAKTKKYKNHLFLPFNDFTNGDETYGGGRYIDLEAPLGSEITLDFNLCYNPYCAYSTGWSCPIPPQENQLKLPIPAGVKTWDHGH